MPGNVNPASPVSVFPQSLSTSFSEDRSFVLLQSTFHDGSIIRGQLAATSRRTFRQSKRLTAVQIGVLKTFWDAHGPTIPFLFYNPYDQTPGQKVGSNYDASGASTVGRYTVVFRNTVWSQSMEIVRGVVGGLELIEVA